MRRLGGGVLEHLLQVKAPHLAGAALVTTVREVDFNVLLEIIGGGEGRGYDTNLVTSVELGEILLPRSIFPMFDFFRLHFHAQFRKAQKTSKPHLYNSSGIERSYINRHGQTEEKRSKEA